MAIGYLLMQARTAHDALPLSGVQVRILDTLGNNIYDLTTDESGETQKVPLETMNRSFSQNPYFTGLPYTSYHVLARKNGFNSLYISDIPIYDGETAVLPLSMVPMQALQRSPLQTDIPIGKPAVAMQDAREQVGPGYIQDTSTPLSDLRTPQDISFPVVNRQNPQHVQSMPSSMSDMLELLNTPSANTGMQNAQGAPSSLPGMQDEQSAPSSLPGMQDAQSAPSSLPGMQDAQSAPSSLPGMQDAQSAPSSLPGMQNAQSAPSSLPGMQNAQSAPSSLPGMQNTLSGTMPRRRNEQTPDIQARREEASNPRVLRQVVIPNPITVHLGTPNASAANVQVSFPDYVKNVASSEIYPTWPDASLRANIYAIITFALNRVFTEWYRSRGYNFDITNSTAYDQSFVYGRPIYDSVSRIVDEIFNEYVRRQNQNAPYFTSFCNGTTVTCRGLSQWGTVSLANQGLTPLQILRTYYPSDIEITETNIITGVLSSYPGTPLRTGSTGLDVQTVQTYLNRIRRNYPAIPAITDEAGVFGNSTKDAVTAFQRIFNLTSDGIVGQATWYKISSLYAGIAKLAELDSEGTSLGIGTVPPTAILRQGSRGQDVITLQYLLNIISEYYPGIPAPMQDGVFGSGTRQSVVAFQQLSGLQSDGIVGPRTWEALYNAYHGIQQNIPFPGTGSGVVEYTVRPGDSLWLIARKYDTTVNAIKSLNGLTSDLLNIGQVLKIPVSQNIPYVEYIVRSGDTLWLLARRYGTTVEAIMRLNGLTSDALSIGQVLRIPK